jgi:acetyl-CoA carboxylase carboxyl transferase subunit alpha
MELEFEKPLSEVEARLATLKQQAAQQPDSPASPQIAELDQQRIKLEKTLYDSLTPWQTVQVARHPNRPRMDDYLAGVFS